MTENKEGQMDEIEVGEQVAEESPSPLVVSNDKFHSIYGHALAVCLEATIFTDDPVAVARSVKPPNPALVRPEPKFMQVLFFYPASSDHGEILGVPEDAREGMVVFVPWFDRSLAAFHRIQLRVRRPMRSGSSLPTVQVWFAREGEEKAFQATKPSLAEGYIHLDWFSKGKDEFRPLFVKIKDEDELVYLVLEAKSEDNTKDAAVLWVKRIAVEEAPPHLIVA